jgi:hypothetical protein
MKAKELTELGPWKVGQEVALSYPSPQNRDAIKSIERITDGRNGTIYVDNMAFDVHGRERTSNQWTFHSISVLTPEVKENIIKTNRKNKLVQFKFSSLTIDQASNLVLKMREMGIAI